MRVFVLRERSSSPFILFPRVVGGTVLILLLLVSCATSYREAPASEAFDLDQAQRMFAAGYQDIGAVYITAVPLEDLAVAGLQRLQDIDGDLVVERESEAILVRFGGAAARRYGVPAAYDSDGWARLTAAVVADVRERSTPVAEASSERIYEAVFDGMTSKLDGVSRYSSREEAAENRASRDGFGGIGVAILVDEGKIRIESGMPEGPGGRAGLLPGDVIVAVDGQPLGPVDAHEAVAVLRGPVGTRIELLVERGNAERRTFRMVRGHIVPETVKAAQQGGILTIRVSGFNQDTTASLRDALVQPERQGGLRGMILDLRDNPGGLLDQAVSVSDLFLSRGRILSTRGRHPESFQVFDARLEAVDTKVPMIVLVNGDSASAAEIVAAALQDNGRAVVVGSSSYGKGTVQTVMRLPNEGELTLTWARFAAPSGYSIDKRGVLPNVCLTDESAPAQVIVDQLRQGRHLMDRALIRANVDPNDVTAVAWLRAHCPSQEADPPLDMEGAERLLDDSHLFALAASELSGAGRADRPSVAVRTAGD